MANVPIDVTKPEWAPYRRVDECIECLPISRETQKELLEKMPDAYGGEAPGEDAWPEPDAKRDEPYKLTKVWNALSDAAKSDLNHAWRMEHDRRYKLLHEATQ